jgi:DNA gyrase subunit A
MENVVVKTINIEDEMSVIVGRALPDVRDGLKPVHRRVLFAMNELGNEYNKAYKKSARVVGDVIGKYHPHGDSAVYDTIVRMAQDFSMRYMLVDGQGNFGSVDGDSAAAMRYTEVRMAKIAKELLGDLDKDTVDWVPNYDGTEMIPAVLPTRIPNLLINGSSGIAVGMATNIPPHNLLEVVDGCLALVDNKDMTIDELMTIITGPDFPTGGIISGVSGIEQAYRTGRGSIYVRAKAIVEVDENNGRETIIVNEIPYQVNKAKLIEKIAELVKDKRIEGILALRDESDKDGMRIVIEIKRGESGEIILNNLYKHTQMQTTFGINMLGLVDNQPRTLNLKEMLEVFILHRREVVTRRTLYELEKARDRAHILEALGVALGNMDRMIQVIRQSATPSEAKEKLMGTGWEMGHVVELLGTAGKDTRPKWLSDCYGVRDGLYLMTEEQAQAILDLRLQKLTGLERDKIVDEFVGLLTTIAGLLAILNDGDRLLEVIREELIAVRDEYNEGRRTEITLASGDINIEDLITPQDVVVTLSHQGYVKYQPVSDYEAQRRGGRGKSATRVKEEDFVEKLLVANTHDTILCFSTTGKVYWLKVYQLPEASRGARGRPIVNMLPLKEGERVTAILPIKEYRSDHYVFFATANGTVKKTALSDFSRPLSSGIRAITLREDDELIGVDITDGTNEIMLFSDNGKVVRFPEDGNRSGPVQQGEEDAGDDADETEVIAQGGKGVRVMGRTAAGVRGIRLLNDDKVVSLIVPRGDGAILTVTENGYGKRTELKEYPIKNRGTQGVISIKVDARNGKVIDAIQVVDTDEIMLITNGGTLVRTRVSEVNVIGRNTSGVRIIRTGENETVVGLERIAEPEQVETEQGE